MRSHPAIKAFKYLLATAVVGMVGVFVYRTDFSELATYLGRLPQAFMWVMIVTFFAYLSGTISWWFCIDTPYKRGLITRMWIIRHVGEMLAIFNPTNVIAGDSLKSIYLGRSGIRQDKANASVVLSRLVLIVTGVLLMIVSGIFFMIDLVGLQQVIQTSIVAVITIAIIFGVCTYFRLIRRIIAWIKTIGFVARFLDGEGGNQLRDSMSTFKDYVKTSKVRVFWALFFGALHWVLGAAEIYVILDALGQEVTVIDAVFFEMGVQFLKSLAFLIPGQIGVEEYANKIVLTSMKISANEVWLILSVMRRARQLLWLAVAALLYIYLKRIMKPIYQRGIVQH